VSYPSSTHPEYDHNEQIGYDGPKSHNEQITILIFILGNHGRKWKGEDKLTLGKEPSLYEEEDKSISSSHGLLSEFP
jgi:hypothetical protein